MTVRHCRNTRGVTLVEVMAAVVFMSIAVLGAMGFRYYSASNARRADVKITASRLSLLLLESWKGAGAASSYDPVAEFGSELTISTSDTGPAVPTGFSALGSYHIVANRANYYATLSYKAATSTEPKTLNVCVAWLGNYQTGTVSGTDQSIKLTTYAGD